VTRELFPILEQESVQNETYYNGYARTMRNFPPLLYKQIKGVRVARQEKIKLAEEYGKRAKLASAKITALAGKTVNPDSPDQLARFLYGQLGLPIQFNHKTKRPSTDKDSLNRLLRITKINKNLQAHEILNVLNEYKKLSKLNSTYLEMEVEDDDRVRTSYTWVSTYRLSSSQSHFGGGGNLQNIPARSLEGKAIRSLFLPDKGKLMVRGDLKQAEAQEVAYLAGDTRLIEFFQAGKDIHWLNAILVFSFPQDLVYEENEEISDVYTGELHKMKFYRRLAKTVVHAANYGMGPRMLQTILIREEVYLSEAVCKQLLHSYRNNNPLIVQWQNRTIEEVTATRVLTTPLGRRRYFRGRLGPNLFRSAIAFRPQSTVGELLQIADRSLWDNCPQIDSLLNVHDEIVGQCFPEDIKRVVLGMTSAMEIPHVVNSRELTIPVEMKIGFSWEDCQEINIQNFLEDPNAETKAKELAERAALIC